MSNSDDFAYKFKYVLCLIIKFYLVPCVYFMSFRRKYLTHGLFQVAPYACHSKHIHIYT